jgi:hypothetical protein
LAPVPGGGVDGNEVLTTVTGVVLVVLLAPLGVTIVWIGPLLWEHLFGGLLLIGPVGLKLSSTGYRFTRYYAHDAAYVAKGPPWTPLRLIAPIVVISTVVVFATGLVMLFGGPPTRQPWLLLHKVSFIVWIAFTALHVLGHVPEVGRLLGVRAEIVKLPGIRTDPERFADGGRVAAGPGAAARLLAIAASVVVGLVVALVLVPDYHAWTAAPLFHHG